MSPASPVRAGFAKVDITPEVGVELCGFGPYLNRRSIAVRDQLWARAMAVEAGGERAVIVSCDLAGTARWVVERARALVTAQTGLPGSALLVLSTHTHSAPTAIDIKGWGEPNVPYRELLPGRIARAACAAIAALVPVRFAYAESPCEGIGQNREYDRDALSIAEVLAPGWRPLKPELTDTTVHVLTATSEVDGRLLGIVSHFGCHPVVCCQETRYIHGDFPGVANTALEAEHPGAVALFVQGAQGDVNSSVVHKPEADSLKALDVIAGRYADFVRAGMRSGRPLAVDAVRTVETGVRFTRRQWTLAQIEALAREKQAAIDAAVSPDDHQVRLAMVALQSLREMAAAMRAGADMSPPISLHGLRIGPIAVLGSPFEVFQAIKNDTRARTSTPITWIATFVDDLTGYAPDRATAARGGYAQDQVPLMLGYLPYANAHDELVEGLVRLERELAERMPAHVATNGDPVESRTRI